MAALAALGALLLPLSAWGDKGMLRIITEPGDAQIYINGQRKGSSPSEAGQSFAIKLPQGEYTVEAALPTDEPKERYGKKKVYVSDDTLQTVTITLDGTRQSPGYRAVLKRKYGGRAIEPEMVSVPAGSFLMGSPASEPEREDSEGPQHRVTLRAFDLGKYELTFEEWDACFADGGCEQLPDDEGWGRGRRPVINVSWNDAQQYIAWLNRKTGKHYRLPSEAEWEYAARAGTTTFFHTGDCINTDQANFAGSNHPVLGCPKGESRGRPLPVGQFAANAWGLFDMHGNTGEFVEDCEHSTYQGAPSDGSAWTTGCKGDSRGLRGGGWQFVATGVRAAYRLYLSPGHRMGGFRLARTR